MRLAGVLAAMLLLPLPGQGQGFQRCRVIDGDTLRCGGESVRILGLDAPETRGACQRETRLARRATRRMERLVAGGVTVEPRGRDRYGRLLAVVRDQGGRDVAAVMIREGLARPYEGRRRQSWCRP